MSIFGEYNMLHPDEFYNRVIKKDKSFNVVTEVGKLLYVYSIKDDNVWSYEDAPVDPNMGWFKKLFYSNPGIIESFNVEEFEEKFKFMLDIKNNETN